MTITDMPSTTLSRDDHPASEVLAVGPAPFHRSAGPLAVLAAVLMLAAQGLWLPYDPKDHQVTSQNVVFQAGGVVYLAGFCVLLLALIGAYGWQVRAAGRFGAFAAGAAIIGTMLLGGDLWFEVFVTPWLADGPAPGILETDPTIFIGAGAVFSYLAFALGWTLFGIASYRARVFPRALSAALVAGGVIGWWALLAPMGMPLALAVGALGIWMIRRG